MVVRTLVGLAAITVTLTVSAAGMPSPESSASAPRPAATAPADQPTAPAEPTAPAADDTGAPEPPASGEPLPSGQPSPAEAGANGSQATADDGDAGDAAQDAGTQKTAGAAAAKAAAPPATADVAVTTVTRTSLGTTWGRGCPVSVEELRRVTTHYWAFDGTVKRGSVVLHADAASGAKKLFEKFYEIKFPIQRLAELTAFDNNLARAQRAGATVGFGCRRLSNATWQPRSLGRTLALNPRQNPMKDAKGNVVPKGSEPYLDRADYRPGMLTYYRAQGKAVRAVGWRWSRLTKTDHMNITAAPPTSAKPRVERISAADVPHSYRSGCPVKPSGLRRVLLYHWGFDGKLTRGEIIARTSAVDDISRVFNKAYAKRFPFRKMHRVDLWRANDERAMNADNTSAFNCRKVTGTPYRLSQHSYGNAIDINTIENPYVTSSRVYPSRGRPYLDRSPYRKGMILSSGVVARGFRSEGWPWGARWAHPDYQHFSSNGG